MKYSLAYGVWDTNGRIGGPRAVYASPDVNASAIESEAIACDPALSSACLPDGMFQCYVHD